MHPPQLIPGGKNHHQRLQMHRHLADALRGQDTHGRRAEHCAGLQHRLSGAHVLPGWPHVGPRRRRHSDAHLGRRRRARPFTLVVRVFHRHHSVGPSRQRRARHDARHRAQRQRGGLSPAGGDVGANRQMSRLILGGARHLAGPHGVSVHAGVAEGRQVGVGHHIVRQDAAGGLVDGDRLAA